MKKQVRTAIRFLLFWILFPFLEHGTYSNPDQVMGYTGWYTLGNHTVAFAHKEGLQFRW